MWSHSLSTENMGVKLGTKGKVCLLLTSYGIYSVGERNMYSNKVFRIAETGMVDQPAPEDHWGLPQLEFERFPFVVSACHNLWYMARERKLGLRKSRTQNNKQLHVACAPRWHRLMTKQAAKPELSGDSYNLISRTVAKDRVLSLPYAVKG